MTTNYYWLGEEDKPSCENYRRISACSTSSQAVYAPDAGACVKWLTDLKESLSSFKAYAKPNNAQTL
ncbi:unnamed protein product [Didymodactylos carnosus]|uniref:Uncharacterized protein n=1 Tax=Didymodactylos carnosus TaxID=1234261 RepID=A0A8S2MWH4_9BILA|nr:unnamed protein product [Didymodactylos carnosus]